MRRRLHKHKEEAGGKKRSCKIFTVILQMAKMQDQVSFLTTKILKLVGVDFASIIK